MSRWLRLVAVLRWWVEGVIGAVGALYWLGNALTHAAVRFEFLVSRLLFTGLSALCFMTGLYPWKRGRRGIVLSRRVQAGCTGRGT